MKATLKENKEKIVSLSELNNGGVGKIFLDLQKNQIVLLFLKSAAPAGSQLPPDVPPCIPPAPAHPPG